MPWILRSAEIFDSGDGKFVCGAEHEGFPRRSYCHDFAKRQSFDCRRRIAGGRTLRSCDERLCRNRRDGVEPPWSNRDVAARRWRADRGRWISETRGLRSRQRKISLRRHAQRQSRVSHCDAARGRPRSDRRRLSFREEQRGRHQRDLRRIEPNGSRGAEDESEPGRAYGDAARPTDGF